MEEGGVEIVGVIDTSDKAMEQFEKEFRPDNGKTATEGGPRDNVHEMLQIISGRHEDETEGRSKEKRTGRHTDERVGKDEGKKERPVIGLLDDGRKLVEAAIRDEENLVSDPEFDVKKLETINNALLEIATDSRSARTMPYREIKLLRSYFRRKAGSIQVVGETSAEYQSHYEEIYSAINRTLPTPESILPDVPTYELPDNDTLIKFLKDGDEQDGLDVADSFFNGLAEDTSSKKGKTEKEKKKWKTHLDAISEADHYFYDHKYELDTDPDTGATAPLFVTVEKSDDENTPKIDVKVYDGHPSLFKDEDGVYQFIYEHSEDGPYVRKLEAVETTDQLAQDAVAGIKNLKKDPPVITSKQRAAISFFVTKLGKEFRDGERNDTNEELFTEMFGSVGKKLEVAEEIEEAIAA